MKDVFKLAAGHYRSCMFWNCWENDSDDAQVARRKGRKRLRQQDEREWSEIPRASYEDS